jgi:cyanophycin synthetase
MQVRVLQGVNLENPVTTIRIDLDAKPKTEIVELIKKFHPVFMEDYSVSGNSVSIQSKLPHLWKEIAVAMNNEATGEWTFNFTKKYVLEMLIGKMVKSMSTIPILHGAHQLGYETIPFLQEKGLFTHSYALKYNRNYSIGVGHESETIISIASSRDSAMAKDIQRDKWLTNILLERLKLPVPKWSLLNSEQHLKEIFDDFKKPVVIKPTGLTGGAGVTTGIKDLEKAFKAYNYASGIISGRQRLGWQTKIMIQEQVEGEDYRLLIIRGKLRIATKRIPAFTTGDGKSSVRQLIEATNEDPRRDVFNPTHILKPIVIDEPLHSCLKEQGLSIDDIPAKGKVVQLRKEASMSRGGMTEDFTDKVNPQIKQIVESLAQTLRTFALGVDVLCKDISKPLLNGNGYIIECNTMPESYLNAFPVIGRQYEEIGRMIVENLVDTSKPTKKIVFLGGEIKKIMKIVGMRLDNRSAEAVGIYSGGSIYINGHEISANLPTWESVEALKLNAALSTIVLHYTDGKEIEENGLGFDVIDKVFVTKEFTEKNPDILERLEGYKNLGIPLHIETL